MTATSMSWWSPAQLECLGALLQQAFDPWLNNWVGNRGESVSSTSARIVLHNAHESPGGIHDCQWTWVGGEGNASAWLGHASPLTETVARALFDDSCHRASIGSRIASAALDELRSALASTLKLNLTAQEPQEKPSAPWGRPWSGHVLASMNYSGTRMRLLLGAECVSALLNTANKTPLSRVEKPALIPATEALAAHAVQIRAGFTSFEIDVGSLLSLGINDVLQLSHSLDSPLQLSNDTLGELCHGYLGQRGGKFAVELIGSAQAARMA